MTFPESPIESTIGKGCQNPISKIENPKFPAMPLYEYACHNCHSQFELLIRASEQPQCPECDSQRLEKLLSVPAAHSASGGELPVCRPGPVAGCGLPQCGQGGCAF
jgi:putative FmdB family regulatory protein